ncbi:MAG TPA: acetamidase/formamidase family protein [Geminicoccaceae bacterium]|nr:acetamidase/formamidase family protein [Geminicoccaceae bacterium]
MARTHHELAASPATCHWGSFDARLAPVLTIQPGDRVTVHTVNVALDVLPGPEFAVPPEHALIHDELRPEPGPHILTGPIRIDGARPGDVLEVRILEVALRQDWGWTRVRPLWGTLPEDFSEARLMHTALDPARGIGRLPWGTELPLRPFFGVMGVAPPPAWGRLSSVQPRAHGGNIDNKELVAGTTLYLPVWHDGALFSTGDGHAAQGDGEVCVTAIETALTGTFEFHLRRDMGSLRFPQAETADAHITMAANADLDDAAKDALRDMIALIQRLTNLDATEAYMLCSLAADVRITQLVNEQKGCHVVLPKSALG